MLELVQLTGLIGGGWRSLAFAPFYPGVEIHRIYGDGTGPSAALLRYQAGAGVPLHEHLGFEHVLMLEGTQEDERGAYSAGTLVVHPPGTRHRVSSAGGCVALLIWEKPVRILL
jgi:anti-sigma factor ChrR (cupin superfamily)